MKHLSEDYVKQHMTRLKDKIYDFSKIEVSNTSTERKGKVFNFSNG
jgi:hypothetical protein